MPMSPAEVERKLQQHEADITDMYDILTKIDARIDDLATEMNTRFEAVDTRFDGIDGQLGEVLAILKNGAPD